MSWQITSSFLNGWKINSHHRANKDAVHMVCYDTGKKGRKDDLLALG